MGQLVSKVSSLQFMVCLSMGSVNAVIESGQGC